MAPRFASGFWGIPTATIDWCEDNYSVTTYIAEFCKFYKYLVNDNVFNTSIFSIENEDS